MKRHWALLSYTTVLAMSGCYGPESLGNKSDWAALQGVEYAQRAQVLGAPVVLQVGDYRVAGIPQSNARGNVWVLLNPSADEPVYKQLPAGNYTLTAQQLAAFGSVDPGVLAQLRLHVQR